MRKPQLPIALEGYPFIFYSAFVSLILAILGYSILALVALFLCTFVIYFFRDPERISPEEKNVLLSPADGKIIIMEKVLDDRFLNTEVLKISIFMNVFNVHVNRIPYHGTVKKILYSPGKFYSADTKKGALQNEYCATTISTEDEKELVFVQVAGLIARRIVNWLEPGDVVKPGQRFGLIRFGSRVDLYLPPDTQLEVRLGQKVKAGESILARLN